MFETWRKVANIRLVCPRHMTLSACLSIRAMEQREGTVGSRRFETQDGQTTPE